MLQLVRGSYPQARLKHLAHLKPGGTPRVEDPRNWAEEPDGVPWVTIGDMSARTQVTRTERYVSEDGLRAARLTVADPPILLFSMYASLGQTALLQCQGCWNQAILGIVPGANVDERFLHYALAAVRPYLMRLARSNTQHNLNQEQVGDLLVPSPPPGVQRVVADFLDRETGRIDDLTARKRSLIGTLRERRRSVVFRASCGLLNDDAVAYDAGLPWTPEVRFPWPKVKIKHVAKLGTGHTPSRSRPEYWEDCTIPWITTGEIQQVRDDRQEVITETREKISELGIRHSSAVMHPKGTVVLCRTASAGFSAIMGDDMATSQDFVTWTCSDRLLPRYLLMCLRAMRQDLLGRLAFGSTHKTIYMPDVEELEIPLPPVEEQQEVLAEIDRHLQPIDALTDRLEMQIQGLQEYRQALITAAVTGQIAVDAA